MPFVELNSVHKNFGQTHVLRGLSFAIEQNEQCAISGASGSGKSTCMYLIGGLDRPNQGEVIVGGQNISQLSDEKLALYRNRYVGFVFQFHFLLPSMTCMENVMLPARIGGADVAKLRARATELAKHLGVEHCLTKYPYQLSGGEQQRINIIRALILRPKLLLCDEPTGNLDSKNSMKVASLLKDLAQEFGATLLVVTHDDKIAQLFSRKITIEDGQLVS